MSDVTVPKRCLICANPDLNLVDGSSVWSQTITLALAATDSLAIDFLARAAPTRDTLFGPLMEDSRITVVDGTEVLAGQETVTQRLAPRQIAAAALTLDAANPYDLIVVRGYQIAKELLRTGDVLARCWLYVTDMAQQIDCIPNAELASLRALDRTRPA